MLKEKGRMKEYSTADANVHNPHCLPHQLLYREPKLRHLAFGSSLIAKGYSRQRKANQFLTKGICEMMRWKRQQGERGEREGKKEKKIKGRGIERKREQRERKKCQGQIQKTVRYVGWENPRSGGLITLLPTLHLCGTQALFYCHQQRSDPTWSGKGKLNLPSRSFPEAPPSIPTWLYGETKAIEKAGSGPVCRAN